MLLIMGQFRKLNGDKMNEKEYKKAFEELKKLRKPISNVNIKHRESLSKLEKIAIKVTEGVGSMGFFLIIFVWTLLWLGWNTMAPKEYGFDPDRKSTRLNSSHLGIS